MKAIKFSIVIRILIIAVLILIGLNLTPAGDFIRNSFFSIAQPAQSVFWSRAVSIREDSIIEDQQSIELKSQIVRLKEDLKRMEELSIAEEERLFDDFEVSVGLILGKSTENDHLILSSGKNDGISEGDPALSPFGTLAGKIVKVFDDYSHVKLVSHPESEFDGRVLDKEDSLGLITGGEILKMKMIDRNVDLEKGDKVVTNYGSGIYPAGIFVGEINEVRREDAETFQEADINSPLNLNNLRQLLIITDF